MINPFARVWLVQGDDSCHGGICQRYLTMQRTPSRGENSAGRMQHAGPPLCESIARGQFPRRCLGNCSEHCDLECNEIRFDPALLERYAKLFAAVRGDTDHPNPYFPYLHLQSEGFWHLQPLPGRETVPEV